MSSSKATSYQPKDYLVEFGQIFQITKIVKQKGPSGDTEPIVHYTSHYPTHNQQTLYCSIPLRSLDILTIRKPITKKEAKTLFKDLSSTFKPDPDSDISNAEIIFQENDFSRTISLVKTLWHEKQDTESNFSSTKETAYEEGLKRISQELALVLSIPLPKVRTKIFSNLKKK